MLRICRTLPTSYPGRLQSRVFKAWAACQTGFRGTLWKKERTMPAPSCIPSLLAALSAVSDPRQPRGVRHPFSSMLALALLGLVCRIHEFAALQRWAASNWRLLRRPLGFTRGRPPHATTLSRTLAKFSLEEFQAAFSQWLAAILAEEGPLAAA